MRLVGSLLLALLCASCAGTADPGAPRAAAEPVLQIAEGPVGFDELSWAPELGRVLVPAGETGQVHLVAPDTAVRTTVDGFTRSTTLRGGHNQGPTSATEASGLVLVIDRSARSLAVIDPQSSAIIGSQTLAGTPDYVRYEPASHTVWVTEPDQERLEIFSLAREDDHAVLVKASSLDVPGGPESLVFDPDAGRAYTNLWRGVTTSIDLATHTLRGSFANGCKGSRVLTIDRARRILFSACAEGRVTAMDLAHGGEITSSVAYASGIDGIAFDAARGVLYAPSAGGATMAALAFDASGLHILREITTAKGVSCPAIDREGDVWLCDPARGRLLRATRDVIGIP